MCVLNSIVPSLRTLIWVAPVAGDVDPGTSFSARSCVVKTHIVAWSLPLGPAAVAAGWPGLVHFGVRLIVIAIPFTARTVDETGRERSRSPARSWAKAITGLRGVGPVGSCRRSGVRFLLCARLSCTRLAGRRCFG